MSILLNYMSSLDETYVSLFTQLLEKAIVQRGKKPASALNLLQQHPLPAAMLITDPTLAEAHPDVWDAIVT